MWLNTLTVQTQRLKSAQSKNVVAEHVRETEEEDNVGNMLTVSSQAQCYTVEQMSDVTSLTSFVITFMKEQLWVGDLMIWYDIMMDPKVSCDVVLNPHK